MCTPFFPLWWRFSFPFLSSIVFSKSLITVSEYEELFSDSIDDKKRSQLLLVFILPRKGPDSVDRFLNVLKETEGQKHVAQKIIETAEKERKHVESADLCSGIREKIGQLERESMKGKATNIAVRKKSKGAFARIMWFVIGCI